METESCDPVRATLWPEEDAPENGGVPRKADRDGEVERHLASCPACRAEARSLDALRRAFRDEWAACPDAPSLSVDFAATLRRRIDEAFPVDALVSSTTSSTATTAVSMDAAARSAQALLRASPRGSSTSGRGGERRAVVRTERRPFRWRMAAMASGLVHAAALTAIVALVATRPASRPSSPGDTTAQSALPPVVDAVDPRRPTVPLDAQDAAWLSVYRARAEAPRMRVPVRAPTDGSKGVAVSLAQLPVDGPVWMRRDETLGFIRVYMASEDGGVSNGWPFATAEERTEGTPVSTSEEVHAAPQPGDQWARVEGSGWLTLPPDWTQGTEAAADGWTESNVRDRAVVFWLSDRLEIWPPSMWRRLEERFAGPGVFL